MDMNSKLRSSKMDTKDIPKVIAAYEDDIPYLSPIDSPLSSAKKKFNAHLMNKCYKHIKDKEQKHNILQDLTIDRKEKHKSKKAHGFTRYDIKASRSMRNKFVIDNDVPNVTESRKLPVVEKGYIKFGNNFKIVESSKKRNENDPDRIFRSDVNSMLRDGGLSDFKRNDDPQDLSLEIIDFFEKQSKKKGKVKKKTLVVTEKNCFEYPNGMISSHKYKKKDKKMAIDVDDSSPFEELRAKTHRYRNRRNGKKALERIESYSESKKIKRKKHTRKKSGGNTNEQCVSSLESNKELNLCDLKYATTAVRFDSDSNQSFASLEIKRRGNMKDFCIENVISPKMKKPFSEAA